MIYFTAHTFKCVCHCRRAMFRVLGMYNFGAGTKVFEEALNAVKFLGWLKKFGSAQNILGPAKGEGIKGQFGASQLRITFSLKSAFWQTNMPITVEEKHILTDKSYSSITLFLAIPN